MSQRVDKRIVVLEDQKLQVKSNAPDIMADLSTDLKFQKAFSRRGTACEQANSPMRCTRRSGMHSWLI